MRKVSLTFKLAFIICSTVLLMANSSGSPGGRTGSPWDGQTCATGSCHGFQQAQKMDIISSDIPFAGYMPDSVYNITVTMAKDGISKFGFEMTVQDPDGVKKGKFTGNSEVTAYISSQRATHKSTSNTGTNSRSWNVQWTAPPAGTGQVNIYMAGLFCNGDNTNSGDELVIDSVEVLEQGAVSIHEYSSQELKVYPNPARDYVLVETDNQSTHFRVYSTKGELVLQQNEGNHIDVSQLAIGTYIIHASIEGHIYKRLFFKL
ncbi:MAG: T9SS type A sorting domain-containing protein [Bacteroidia bacterium]